MTTMSSTGPFSSTMRTESVNLTALFFSKQLFLYLCSKYNVFAFTCRNVVREELEKWKRDRILLYNLICSQSKSDCLLSFNQFAQKIKSQDQFKQCQTFIDRFDSRTYLNYQQTPCKKV